MDISFKIKAEELGKDLDYLTKELEAEINLAVENLANAAFAHIVSKAQQELSYSKRKDYIKGLKLDKLGNNSYLISLEGDWSNKIEDGFSSYDMKPGMLNSEKIVEIGSRAGQKWVQESEEGTKYAHVPFEHHPHGEATSSDLQQELKKMTAYNKQGLKQKVTKIFKDDFGKPMSGKVASQVASEHPFLQNLTKFQHINEKGTVSNLYMTWRTVSEKSSGWINPGYEGLDAFASAEKWVEEQMDLIIQTLL